jgi:hypothetical protein
MITLKRYKNIKKTKFKFKKTQFAHMLCISIN